MARTNLDLSGDRRITSVFAKLVLILAVLLSSPMHYVTQEVVSVSKKLKKPVKKAKPKKEVPSKSRTVVVQKQQELPLKVKSPAPTLEQLSIKAAETLSSLRRQIERDAQRDYETAKFKEVKRLADEAKLDTKFIVATIEAKEEIRVKS